MSNLHSVFAAYALGWTVFFVYFLTIARRQFELREEIEKLRALVGARDEVAGGDRR
jgi:CcmD family protein